MIVAGFGFRKAATVDSLADALARTGAHPTHIATLQSKARTGVFRAFARARSLPVIEVPDEQAQMIDTPTKSAPSLAAKGTGSVAEAAAIAACFGGTLIAKRFISNDQMATCAIAKGSET